MPYIKQEDRERVDRCINDLTLHIRVGAANGQISGLLNYTITRLLLKSYFDSDKVNYARLNDLIGVLHCVESEINRRLVGPYEDSKISENGDVSEFQSLLGTIEKKELTMYHTIPGYAGEPPSDGFIEKMPNCRCGHCTGDK